MKEESCVPLECRVYALQGFEFAPTGGLVSGVVSQAASHPVERDGKRRREINRLRGNPERPQHGAAVLQVGGSPFIPVVLGFLSYLVFGLIQLFRYRRKMRAFELQQGTDAGKQ